MLAAALKPWLYLVAKILSNLSEPEGEKSSSGSFVKLLGFKWRPTAAKMHYLIKTTGLNPTFDPHI